MKTDLKDIPGIGKDLEKHLINAGYYSIHSLKGQNPEEMYLKACALQGCHVDKCVLNCYRLAVYYADHNGQLPYDKQYWWNWMD